MDEKSIPFFLEMRDSIKKIIEILEKQQGGSKSAFPVSHMDFLDRLYEEGPEDEIDIKQKPDDRYIGQKLHPAFEAFAKKELGCIEFRSVIAIEGPDQFEYVKKIEFFDKNKKSHIYVMLTNAEMNGLFLGYLIDGFDVKSIVFDNFDKPAPIRMCFKQKAWQFKTLVEAVQVVAVHRPATIQEFT